MKPNSSESRESGEKLADVTLIEFPSKADTNSRKTVRGPDERNSQKCRIALKESAFGESLFAVDEADRSHDSDQTQTSGHRS
jgi:hypothetical protein